MMNQKELLKALDELTPTYHYYELYPQVILTDAVMYLMEAASCYWLGNIVWSYQSHKKIKGQAFQVYDLKVNLTTKKAKLTVTDGNYKVLYKQNIPFTTFPLKSLRLYYCNNVLMLSSEY